ncbi:MAG TPA: amino acid adenylation domain-containing protein, partial [Legionellaceae bacterium]|nr:amino acid adenylation domain-containing protein [Legionellaceae bacterium]
MPNLDLTYGDYVLSQHEATTNEAFKQGLEFWKTKLSNAEQIVHLPYDYARPEWQNYEGEQISILYNSKQLLAFAKKIGCTVYAVLFSAYALLLHKLSGQSDVTIGTVCQTRHHLALDALFGYFLNTIPIRSQCNIDENMEQFVKNFSKNLIECLAFADIPFGHIVAETQTLTSMTFSPLFQLLFTYFEHQNITEISGCTIERMHIAQHASRYDITLEIEKNHDELRFNFEYDKNLFRKQTINGLVTYYCNIIEQIITCSEKPIKDTYLLDDLSLQMFYHSNSGNTVSYEHNDIWHFLNQAVANRPTDIAIVYEEEKISFAVLNDLSNDLAFHLQKSIKKGDVVATCMTYTYDLPIAILAILKAGAIYLPLEPDFPENRLNFMLDDSKAALCIVDPLTCDKALNVHRFLYDSKKTTSQLKCVIENYTECAPLYLIYTSGSTGTPKGVLGSYQATLNRFSWMWTLLPFEKDEITLARTSVAFVDSIWEMLGSLLGGSSICMLSASKRKDLSEFTQALNTYKITRFSILPGLLRELIAYWQNNDFSAQYLKIIISSGEVLPTSTTKAFLNLFPNINLINLYGSSEVAGDVSFHMIQPEDVYRRTIPIGIPIQNTQIYICNAQGQVLAPGEIGELIVSGQGLNLGYLNNPTLTKQRFFNKTFWSNTKRVFYTGDNARLLFNGQLEYLGRSDSVEKIRGVRVNLGEIDEFFTTFKEIKTAVSIVVGHPDKRIKTFIVPNEKNINDAFKDNLIRVVRAKLHQTFPTYLHPDLIEFLEQLPVNNNGKIDIQALQKHQSSYTPSKNDSVILQSPTTIKLHDLVKEITKNEQIDIQSSLISQGFNSLDIIVLINKIAYEFKEKISIKDFFDTPSIAALSDIIDQRAEHITDASFEDNVKTLDNNLSLQQQQICFIQRAFTCHAAFILSARINVDGNLDVNQLSAFLDILYKRHPILGANILHDNEQSYINYQHKQLLLHIVRLDEATNVDAYVQQYLDKSFDMTEALFKTTVLQISPMKQIVLFQAHHIIFDAWSFNIFIHELVELYQKNSNNLEYQSKNSYAHYVLWQKEYSQTAGFIDDCNYWLQELANPPQNTTWPEIYTRPNEYTFDAGIVKSSINKDLYANIQKFSADTNITTFTYFLTCYIALLYHRTKNKHLIIGVPVSNRIDGVFNNCIGLFSNTLPLCVTIDESMTFSQMLTQVKQKMVNLLHHQNITLSQLLDITKPKRSANKHPFFQTIFSYNDQYDIDIQFSNNTNCTFETCSANAVEYDFSFFFFCSKQSIDILIKYNSNIYNQFFIAEILNTFQTISAHFLYAPHLPLDKLNDSDGNFIRYGKGAALDFEKHTLIELITRSAEQYSNKIALIYKDKALTYGALLDLIHQLSFQLTQASQSNEQAIIGVLLQDPIDRLIAMLALFHQQSIYLPLDPDDPIERLKTIIEDSNPAFI